MRRSVLLRVRTGQGYSLWCAWRGTVGNYGSIRLPTVPALFSTGTHSDELDPTHPVCPWSIRRLLSLGIATDNGSRPRSASSWRAMANDDRTQKSHTLLLCVFCERLKTFVFGPLGCLLRCGRVSDAKSLRPQDFQDLWKQKTKTVTKRRSGRKNSTKSTPDQPAGSRERPQSSWGGVFLLPGGARLGWRRASDG